MQIGFFICNCETAEELIYSGPQLEKIKEAGRGSFLVEKERFGISESVEILFTWDGKSVDFLLHEKGSCRFFEDGKIIRNKCFSEQCFFTIVTAKREKFWLSLIFYNTVKAKIYLTKQNVDVGRGAKNTICCVGDRFISDLHLRIRKKEGTAEAAVEGRNGIYINRRYIGRHGKCRLYFGDEICFFSWKIIWLDSLLAVYSGAGQDVSAALLKYTGAESINVLAPAGRKGAGKDRPEQVFSPSPRNYPVLNREAVELEFPPEKREEEKQPLFLTIGPAFTMALPMLAGFGSVILISRSQDNRSGTFLYMGIITAVTSAFLGVFWGIMNVRQRQKRIRQAEGQRQNAYLKYAADCEERIMEKYRYNRNVLRNAYPSVEECLCYGENSAFLWNRSTEDQDFFVYRLGVGNMALETSITLPKERFSVTEDTLKLLPMHLKEKYGVLRDVPVCIDLKEEHLHGILGSSEEELREVLLLLAMQIAVTSSAQQVCFAFLFLDKKRYKKCMEVFKWLPHVWLGEERLIAWESAHIAETVRRLEQTKKCLEPDMRHLFIFTDHYDLPGHELQCCEEVSVLLFTDDYGEIPGCCHSMILRTAAFSGKLTINDKHTERNEIYFDRFSLKKAERYARQLCGLKLEEVKTQKKIPEKVTIFELLGISDIDWRDIYDNWQVNRSEAGLPVGIGMAEGGRICILDLHEKGHGPHGLIAGMTGSGKSEMLQTIIISLAMKFSPWEVGFFLIDYKGGGMAGLFSKLPHLLGSISNLSGSMIYRAMVSIRSENERRQRIFLKAGVNQISDYHKLYRNGKAAFTLPHIFIMIDEFAELKREEPDFMRELISVAQVGRSLGIHLILATQKPSGTVDDNIWSNARFRICLKVQDRQDSSDMLHKPDAAYIKNPGRAVLQVGNHELYEMFQGAYTMEPCAEKETLHETETVCLLDEFGRQSSRYLPPGTYQGEAAEQREPQIIKMLEAVFTAAVHCKFEKLTGLWLPPLDSRIFLSELVLHDSKGDQADNSTDRMIYRISVGKYDHPKKQQQGIFQISLPDGGHQVICGTAACGKSTFLQTVLYSFIYQENPETLQIYIIDYSSGLLAGFAKSALVGGVIAEEEGDELPKLFCMLARLHAERKRLLRGSSFCQCLNMPAVLLVIDNYGSFREKTGACYDSLLQELAKTGENDGIYLFLTASGVGNNGLPGRIFENVRTGICLSMNDKYRYCEILRISHLQLRLPENIKGRGMALIGGEVLEFQCALCAEGENDFERMENIQKMIDVRNRTYCGRRVPKIPRIPKNSTLTKFFEVLEERQTDMSAGLPAGYEEISGKIYLIPVFEIKHVMITGRRRTGKKNMLSVIKKTAEKYGFTCSEIKTAAGLAACIKKNEKWNGKGFLYIINDFAEFINEFYSVSYEQEIERLLMDIFGRKSLHKIVAAVKNEDIGKLAGRGLFEVFHSDVYGIHMGGRLDSQNLLDFSYLPFSRQSIAKKAGQGTVSKLFDPLFCGDISIPLDEDL